MDELRKMAVFKLETENPSDIFSLFMAIFTLETDNPSYIFSVFIVAVFTRYSFYYTNFILELLQLVKGNKWTDVKYSGTEK